MTTCSYCTTHDPNVDAIGRGQKCLQMLEHLQRELAISTGGEICNSLAPACAEGRLNLPAAAEEGIDRDCPTQHDLNRGNLIGICSTQDSMKPARKPLQHCGPLLRVTIR